MATLRHAQLHAHRDGARESARLEGSGGVDAFVLHPEIVRAEARAEPSGLQQRRHAFAERDDVRGVADRKQRSVAPHRWRRAGERFALPGCAGLFEIVADQKRTAAFAQSVDLAGLAPLAADAALEIRNGGHVGSSIIAIRFVAAC